MNHQHQRDIIEMIYAILTFKKQTLRYDRKKNRFKNKRGLDSRH